VKAAWNARAPKLIDVTPETQLVVALCRTPLSTSAVQVADDLVRTGIDWDETRMIAANFEVEPVFYSNIRNLPGNVVPRDFLDSAVTLERESRAFALTRSLILADLVRKFDTAGIPVLVIKGPAISLLAYGDVSLRSYHDIDLLTTPDALTRARDLLLSIGYSREYDATAEAALISGDHALEFVGAGSRVELHTALVERYLKFQLETSRMWDEAIPLHIAGTTFRTLDPARTLVFLCAHGAKHGWICVRWLCDVAQLADRLTSEQMRQVVYHAQRSHATGIVAFGLQLAAKVFGKSGVTLPDEIASHRVASECKLTDVARRLVGSNAERVGALRGRELPAELSLLRFWTAMRERYRDRLGILVHLFFVPVSSEERRDVAAWISRPVTMSLRLLRFTRGR
jgi:hypothetical protein